MTDINGNPIKVGSEFVRVAANGSAYWRKVGYTSKVKAFTQEFLGDGFRDERGKLHFAEYVQVIR